LILSGEAEFWTLKTLSPYAGITQFRFWGFALSLRLKMPKAPLTEHILSTIKPRGLSIRGLLSG